MKTVTIYEVSQTKRTLETTYDKIPIHELELDGGRAWGNPGGGERYIRYDLPVTRVVEERVEDGFTHRREVYVAIGPRLLELIGPAVNEGLARVNSAKSREIEDLLVAQKANLRAIESHRDRAVYNEQEAVRRGRAIGELEDRLRNFEQANVLTRIWRAIKRAI